jgi:hypothetical protein
MQRQWLVDPETGSPQDHDESAKPPTVQTVADDLHDRDDLRDGRWVGRIAQAPCCVEDDRHESRESSPATGDDRLRQEQVTRLYPRIRPEAHTESTALAPRASSAIRGLPLGPRSESAERHRRTPSPLLSRMERSALGTATAECCCQAKAQAGGASRPADMLPSRCMVSSTLLSAPTEWCKQA